MQRIDENTYIDDTLVTCAEYQLFVDEMREQGKYFQPDHWVSYQFPDGWAREPVFGVRHSDVQAFCKWLSGRENEGWIYRLSTVVEAKKHLLNGISTKPHFGYWTISREELSPFVWVGSSPHDPRKFQGSTMFSRDRDVFYAEYDFTINNIAVDIDEDLDTAEKINLSIKSYLNRDRDLTYTISDDTDIDFVRKYVDNVITPKQIGYSDALNRDIELARFQTRKLALKFLSEFEPVRKLNRYNDLIKISQNNISAVLRILIDILTLQERIAGRSPAFEGIRLVKERIK